MIIQITIGQSIKIIMTHQYIPFKFDQKHSITPYTEAGTWKVLESERS